MLDIYWKFGSLVNIGTNNFKYRRSHRRFRRFEAEKLALSEMTARKRDSEANRFTRHEVKNGLLASLGLCDGISDLAKLGQTNETLEKLSAIVPSEYQDDLRKLSSTIDSMVRIAKV